MANEKKCRNSPLFKSDHTYTKQPAIQSLLSSVVLPRDHIGWSIINTVYMNFFCLGAVALYFSIKSRDRKVVGDLEGARYYGSRARCFNVAALAVSLLFFLIFLILVIFSVSVISGKSFSLELGSPQN